MSDTKRERLSTLIDGELSPREADATMGAIYETPALFGTWDRYHLIGDALRGEPVSRDVLGIAQRVRKHLEQEPTVLVPAPARIPRRYIAPLVATALAASVALMALLILPGIYGDVEVGAPRVVSKPPAAVQYADNIGTHWGLRRPEVESKLNGYLINHQEYAPTAGMKGILPYASFVSYDARP